MPAFRDRRYVCVEGRPLFVVYEPFKIPNCPLFMETWRDLAERNGLEGVHFVGIARDPDSERDRLLELGFDGVHTQRIGKARII